MVLSKKALIIQFTIRLDAPCHELNFGYITIHHSFSSFITGIPVLSTHGDYYTEVMSHLHSQDMDGLLSDDPLFVLLNPPRLFAAHDFKLTYKGSLETKEYLLEKWCQDRQISTEHFPLLGSLLGRRLWLAAVRRGSTFVIVLCLHSLKTLNYNKRGWIP